MQRAIQAEEVCCSCFLFITAAADGLDANKLYHHRQGFADKYLEAGWRSRFHPDVIQLLTPDADTDLCAPGGLDIAKISPRHNGLPEIWSQSLQTRAQI